MQVQLLWLRTGCKPWRHRNGFPRMPCCCCAFASCACSNPVPWEPQGGWGDCDPSFPVFTANVPNGGNLFTVSIPLPVSLIKGWLAFEGTQNFGFLLR